MTSHPAIRLASILGAALATACGGDDENDEPKEPPPPPTVTISEMRPAGGPMWQRGDSCVELGRDPKQTIALGVTTTNWTMRALYGCGGLSQCGTGTVTIGTGSTAETALGDPSFAGTEYPTFVLGAPSVSIPFAEVFDGDGAYTFRAELWDETGSLFSLDRVFDVLTVDVRTACSGRPDAGGNDAGVLDGGVDAGDASSDGSTDASVDGPTSVDASADVDAAPMGEASADATATDATDASATDAATGG